MQVTQPQATVNDVSLLAYLQWEIPRAHQQLIKDPVLKGLGRQPLKPTPDALA